MLDLFTPDDFKYDWYGYLTNQISHVGLGMFFVWLVCALSFLAIGELPFKIAVFFAMSLLYFSFEMIVQGWRGLDTLEDMAFVVMYGSGGTLLAFSELNIGSTLLVFNMYAPLIIIGLFFCHLAIGCFVRWRRVGITK